MSIGVLGSMIFGLDHDDESIFEKTADFVDKAKLTFLFTGYLLHIPTLPYIKNLKAKAG